MNKNGINYIITAIGILLLVTGLFLLKTITNPVNIMKALPYVCVGIGCGLFGHGMGNIIAKKALENNPDIQEQIIIDKNDERNIAIANRAKAKAYDMMIFIFGALMISFALMGIDMTAVLMLVVAYLLVVGYGIFYRIRFENEM